MEISNIVAVITGGASGLGEATARRLLGNGATGVVVLDVDSKRGSQLAEELGERYLFITTDISNEEEVNQAIAAGVAHFGRVNAVVTAAAIAGPGKLLGKRGPLPMDRFDRVMKINVYGTLHVLRAASAAMAQNEPIDGERGVIINVASGAAYEGQIGQVAYSASKAAVVGMTMPLARELAQYGIRVVTIAPGAFDTPIYETVPAAVKDEMVGVSLFPRRLGYPEEFATFVDEIVRNPFHNGRTYRFDAGTILPIEPGRG